jgi:ABC-type dipeptide/oligopeptide/nickel transport system ATPase component
VGEDEGDTVIIKVLGASGSGKSTVVRAVMGKYVLREDIHEAGRRRPIATRLKSSGRALFVPGHYEIACGGADTIGDLATLYALVRSYAKAGDVLYEGLTLSDTADRVLALARDFPLTVVHLKTPLSVCVERVRQRVGAHGRPSIMSADSIARMHDKCERDAKRMRGEGLSVVSALTEEAPGVIFDLLALETETHA